MISDPQELKVPLARSRSTVSMQRKALGRQKRSQVWFLFTGYPNELQHIQEHFCVQRLYNESMVGLDLKPLPGIELYALMSLFQNF